MGKNNASITDPAFMISAGINPLTKAPIRSEAPSCQLKDNLYRNIAEIDEKNAVNRYVWYNLPKGLTPQMIERVLYFKGQGILFRNNDKYFFLPYALSGTIDVYGRWMQVTPLPFNGTANDGDPENPWIQGLEFEPIYDFPDLEEFQSKSAEEIESFIDKTCVILHDRTPMISYNVLPRSTLQQPIIDLMSDCLPFMRTALLNSTGIEGMKVDSDDDYASVKSASSSLNKAALSGDKYVPIVGSVEFQELTGGSVARAEEFLLAMQSLDNLRLSMYGLESGGLFQKKSHMLEAEQEMNAGNSGLVLQDGLNLRQDFCMMSNVVFGEEMWCEIAETVANIDRDGDGEASGEQEQARAQSDEINDEEEVEIDVE